MAQQQLKDAYELIRSGRTQEAIQLLEPILRTDPNNRDAWWLMANATNDPDTKRQALNQVLRLGNNDSRAQKAQQMLNTIPGDLFDDLDPIPVVGAQSQPQPQYNDYGASVSQSQSMPPQGQMPYNDPYGQNQKQRSGPSCWVIGLAVVGVLVVLCCGGTFFATTVFSNQMAQIFEEMGFDADAFGADFIEAMDTAFLVIPDEFTNLGAIDRGQTVTGEILRADQRDGYTINANQGDNIQINIRATGTEFSIPPIAFVYGPDGNITNEDVTGSYDSNAASESLYVINATQSGTYTIIVRSFFGLGISAYEMTVE